MSLSRELLEARRKAAQEKILALEASEAETLVALVKGVDSPFENDRIWLSGKISQYMPYDIYRYSNQVDSRYKDLSKIFKTFAESNKYSHHKSWAALLNKKGKCIENIPAMDGKQYYSVFDQYVGSSLLKKSIDERDIVVSSILLDIACDECHCLDALKERCRRNAEIIKESKSDADRTFASGQLYNDLFKIGNLFWTPGYIIAADILSNLGNALIHTDRARIGQGFREDAARYFLVGKRLANPALLEDPIDIDHPEDPDELMALRESIEMINVLYDPVEFGAVNWKLAEADFFKYAGVSADILNGIRSDVDKQMIDVIKDIKTRKIPQKEQKI